MISISWQIVLAVIGVVAGFILTDRILERRGYKAKGRVVGVSIDELGNFLREKYLVNIAVIKGDGREMFGVDDFEVEEARTTLEVSGCDEIILISDSDYKYAIKKEDVFIYLHGKFISLEDFSKVWITVQNALRGVKG